MAGDRQYTLVTVVFEQEFDLLVLQARSLRLYCPPGLVADIVVIDNSAAGMPERVRRALMAEYGDLAGLVRIVPAGDFGITAEAEGWFVQQVLKLIAVRLVETGRYVALDAKNHLVAPLERRHLEEPDGRARLGFQSYRNHPSRPFFDRTIAWAGLDLEKAIRRFPQTATPFVLYADLVRRLIDDLTRQEGKPFDVLFVERGFNEFYLYSAWLMRQEGGLDARYALGRHKFPVVWQHIANAAGCRATIAEIPDAMAPFFAVHRLALVRLDAEATGIVAEFWAARGLFPSMAEAAGFIEQHQRRFARPLIPPATNRSLVSRALRRLGLRWARRQD